MFRYFMNKLINKRKNTNNSPKKPIEQLRAEGKLNELPPRHPRERRQKKKYD